MFSGDMGRNQSPEMGSDVKSVALDIQLNFFGWLESFFTKFSQVIELR